MTEAGVVGACAEHAERQGSPCVRCGTFRCAECLDASGLCPACGGLQGVRAINSNDVVGFGRRAGARIIDLVVGQVIGGMAGLVAGMALFIMEQTGLARAGWDTRTELGFGVNFLLGSFASVAGAAVGAWLSGASPGKVLLGLRVVRIDGRRAGIVENVIRELGYFIDGLFFGLVGKGVMDGSPLQQRLGDQWGGTTVVRAEVLRAPVAYSLPRVVLGVAAGLALQALVLGLGFVLLMR